MRTKLLASSMLVAAMFTACQSESDEAVVDSSEMVEVSFDLGGEFSVEDGVLTRATSTFDYYYVAVSSSAVSSGNISSGYVGYFTSLSDVSLSLPKGTYNVYISAFKQQGYTINWSSVNSGLTAGSFKEVSAATSAAPDFADQKVDRYYGSTSQTINTNATVTVNGKRFAYGVNVDIEKPLEGKVVLSSASPAFSFTATTAAVTASNIYSLAGASASATKTMEVTMALYDTSDAVVATQTKTITIARNHMKSIKVKALDPAVSFDFVVEDEVMSDDGEESISADKYECVDLGVVVNGKKILWAKRNIGAEFEYEYGNYYAWGETRAYGEEDLSNEHNYSSANSYLRKNYTWSTYKWCSGTTNKTLTKYCSLESYGSVDEKTVLDMEDDAAHVNWGVPWRIPTRAELNALRSQCDWTWIEASEVNGFGGKAGYKVANKTNSSIYIFLPAAGWRNGTSLRDAITDGSYWSASLDETTPNYAFRIGFQSGNVSVVGRDRCSARSIRPVFTIEE